MTREEFLQAVSEYRGAWVRQAKGLLQGHYAAAEDVVQSLIAEMSAFHDERGECRYASMGLSDVSRLVEYRVCNFLKRDAEDAQPTTEEGDDTESVRFKRGKVTVAWVMEGTEAYQQHVDIKEALASLPHEQRYVAAMVWVEGHTVREVGAMLDLSHVMVLKILAQAKEALRERLSAYGGE
jgi:RNA polymerase sigma factor (sigma-70 family)